MFHPGLDIAVSPPEWIPPAVPGEPFTVQVTLSQGDLTERAYFRIAGADAVPAPLALEAMLPLALVPAMKLGSPLRFSSPISRTLLDGVRRFQEIFSTWYPDFKTVPIHAAPLHPSPGTPMAVGVGVFFSGGLDSSYSLLKHRGELTHAIFVHGCDIPLANTAYRDTTVARLAETARSCGVSLITVETDLLRFSDAFCHWGHHYHGSALAAIGMLLSNTVGKVYLASSTSYMRIVPWGSSAVTDPLWSSRHLEIVHDGAEKERLDKIRTLIQFPVALRNLRVCFETPEGGYNCGHCEKCYRTMVGLRVCGALDECRAFDRPLDLAAMASSPGGSGEIRPVALLAHQPRERAPHGNRLRSDPGPRRSPSPQLVPRTGAAPFTAKRRDCGLAFLAGRTAEVPHRPVQKPARRGPVWFAERILEWLPTVRDKAFDRLANLDRPWFEKDCGVTGSSGCRTAWTGPQRRPPNAMTSSARATRSVNR